MPEPAAPRQIVVSSHPTELRLFLVAGEHSGDHLGARLMDAISAARRGRVRYLGVGGAEMASRGLTSQFALDEVAVIGAAAILRRLPRILRRVYQTVDAAIAAEPDAVVIIDAPEFTHPIARRIRRRRPSIPIIDYVSPSVWAWRPGRARKMARYVDHVLALLPFEPAAHARLGGPPCTYVGHPLIERMDWLAALDPAPLATRLALDPAQPVLVVLPGSRASEVKRLMQPFGQAVERIIAQGARLEILMPTVPSVRALVEQELVRWPLRPHLLDGEDDKFSAFKLARAALAASGTVTLELALAGTPMVVGYKIDAVSAHVLRRLIRADTAVLANLVLGRNAFPEFIQERCTPDAMADAVLALLTDTPTRVRQVAALAEIPARLRLASGTPSEAAARVVLSMC